MVMSCPSYKEIILAVAGDGEAAGAARRHARECAACSAILEEQARVDSLFKAHCAPVEPSPFLWARIEARLTQPAPAPESRWSSLFKPARLYPLAAAVLLAALIATAVMFRPGPGPSSETMLADMEGAYYRTVAPVGEDNPFGVQDVMEPLSGDDNPFRLTAEAGPVAGTSDGNPFTEAIAEGL